MRDIDSQVDSAALNEEWDQKFGKALTYILFLEEYNGTIQIVQAEITPSFPPHSPCPPPPAADP